MKQNLARELLAEVHRRLPAGQRRVQEAFTTEHRRPVLERLLAAAPDQFYFWDEIPARTFCEAIWDYAGQHGGDRLTILDPFYGEVQTHAHRFQKLARRVQSIRVLSSGDCGALAAQVHGLECRNITGTALTRYRGAVVDGPQPVLFIARESARRGADFGRWLGFFSFDPVILEQLGEEIGAVAHGMARRLATFEKLEALHQTTQQVTRELESYSRRVGKAVELARRRPDLLTPARFNRIVSQAVVKMEELKEIPRRALRNIGRPNR
jgi:hypothetical protein